MHRLQDAVIIFGGLNLFHERTTGAIGVQAGGEEFCRVRMPLSEIVVNVDDGDAGRPCTALESNQARRNLEGASQQQFAIRKFEIIDDVD